MYKDKDKQREANREASQRRRDKGMTQGMTNEGMTTRNGVANVIPSSKRGKDIKVIDHNCDGNSVTLASLETQTTTVYALRHGEQSEADNGQA